MGKLLTCIKQNYKQITWILCSFFIVFIGVVKCDGTGAQAALASNLLGLAILPFCLLRIKWREFLSIPCYIFAALWLVCFIPFKRYFFIGNDYDASIVVAYINVLFYGLLFIRSVRTIDIKDVTKNKGKIIISALFALTFVSCIISRNKAVWPLWFLVMFGTFYMEPTDKEVAKEIVGSIVRGVILSFFIFQGYAFLRRPFDAIRYVGIMTNCNVTGMYYFVCYVAFLAEFERAREKKKRILGTILFLFAMSIWAFVMFTACRSAISAFVCVTLLYLVVVEVRIRKRGFMGFVKSGFTMLGIFLVCIPIVYYSIRYIPAFVSHPKLFPTDGFAPSRQITKEDPIDSEKYTSLAESFQTIIGRYDFKNTSYITYSSIESEGEPLTSDNIISIAEIKDSNNERILEYVDGTLPGSDEIHPIYMKTSFEGAKRFLGIRYYIYSFVISEINLFGHYQDCTNIYLTPTFVLYHTHNGFLQWLYSFGYISGFLFIAFSIGAFCVIIKHIKKAENEYWYYLSSAMFQIGFLIICLTECPIILGNCLFSIYFLSLFPCMLQENNETTSIL